MPYMLTILTVIEPNETIQHLSSGKALGSDAIPREINKAVWLSVAEKLLNFTALGESGLFHNN